MKSVCITSIKLIQTLTLQIDVVRHRQSLVILETEAGKGTLAMARFVLQMELMRVSANPMKYQRDGGKGEVTGQSPYHQMVGQRGEKCIAHLSPNVKQMIQYFTFPLGNSQDDTTPLTHLFVDGKEV